MEINIKLDLQEVNALLDTLGQLPTSTNIWPLAAKIRGQAAQQLAPRPTLETASTE